MNWLVMLVTCIQFHNLPVVAYRQVLTFSAIPCDAVGAVKAADLAVHFINNVRRKGFKYRLNRLKNAQEKQKSFGECKIIIRISKGFQNVKDFQCSEYSVENPCQGCWYTISLNNRIVDRFVQVAIQKYNSESNDTNYFSLFNITKVLTKSVPSQRIFVEFIIQETNCFKDDFAVVLTACIPKPHKFAHLGFCTASFDLESPDDDEVDVNCEIYATKGVTVQGLSGLVEPHEDNYPDGEQIFKPKLKRSISKSKRQKMNRPGRKDSSSSESSEEQQMRRHRGPFRRPTIHYHIFPNLPPHPYTCPGQPRYVLRTQ
ncbi:fetuin-B-like isoform X2 [Stegostoma tigrinum]|uniref:fetuin-B-like isoform X2 n=1 Tax=Stegostoma tigrinum TaxID=3053191 RepID=UPI00202B1ACF|nr:fetuin-B-like isoform X2 [Stegostoma tigrinum]